MLRRLTRYLLPLAVLLVATVPSASVLAQDQSRSSLMSREQLESLLQERQQDAQSTAYSEVLRAEARRQAESIRRRLDEGDLRVGDRVMIFVQRRPELQDTFSVMSGRVLDLPLVGTVPLRGILRSELEPYLTEQIGVPVANPEVRVESLIRTAVLGAVSAPNFYTVPSDILVQDAVRVAGGFLNDARFDEIFIRRGDEVIWTSDALRDAMRDGATLDQLNVQGGDEIFVPQERPSATEGVLRSVSIALSIPLAIFAVIQIF